MSPQWEEKKTVLLQSINGCFIIPVPVVLKHLTLWSSESWELKPQRFRLQQQLAKGGQTARLINSLLLRLINYKIVGTFKTCVNQKHLKLVCVGRIQQIYRQMKVSLFELLDKMHDLKMKQKWMKRDIINYFIYFQWAACTITTEPQRGHGGSFLLLRYLSNLVTMMSSCTKYSF